MRVDLEEFEQIFERIQELNECKLGELELFENGKQIEITDKIIEDWRFTGLSNKCFLEFRGWESHRIDMEE